MTRHPHHFKIAFALAISAGSWGIYWLPQRILVEGGLTGGWGTIAQMIIGLLILLPIAIWRLIKKKQTGLELPITGLLVGGGFICYALSFLLTDVVRALILFYMTPIWTTIFEILFLKKRPGLERVLTLGLALGGLWIVFSKQTILPLPENAGDWLALAGGAIFAGGMIRLEVVKTDGVFPIIFSFFLYGALFNIVTGFFLVDYLGEMPAIEAFISMSSFLFVISSIDILISLMPAITPIVAIIFITGSAIIKATSGENLPFKNPPNNTVLPIASTGTPASNIAIICSANSGSDILFHK